MLVFLLSLAVLSVHGQNDNHQDETLRKVLSEVLSEVKMLKETVEKMQDETLKKDEILTETVDKLQAENAALKSDIREVNRSRLMEPVICFSAVKTSNQAASAGDNILFEEELIDTHDTYNPTYGVYAIPQDGVYEVIVTIYRASGTAYNAACELYVGDTFLAMIDNYVDSGTSARFHSAIAIIQEFQAGDALHVVSKSTGSFNGSPTYRASQFSAKYLGPPPSA